MKKLLCLLLSICLTVFIVASAACAETIIFYGGTLEYEVGYEVFLEDYPNTKIDWPSQVYYSTSAFATALLTKDYYCDMFTWGTDAVNWPALIEKGYCLDLSGSKILMDMVGQMHPQIAEQAMKDGHLYAMPTSVGFSFLQISEDVWVRAGFTLEDVPQSFPEFLDFLEKWCDRIEKEPEANIRVMGGWDSSNYTKSAYISKLSHMLVDEAMMQMQYAGEELHFDDPELLILLERCFTVGKRLYQLEPRNDTYALFEESAREIWPVSSDRVVYLRLNGTQPKLIEAKAYMWAIYPATDKAELCIELLEQVTSDRWLDKTGNCADLLLYRDSQAQLNPSYESEFAKYTARLDDVNKRLEAENLSADERTALEDEQLGYQSILKNVEENKWIMTAEQLADYQASADRLFFRTPGIFDNSSTGYETLNSLCDRFANEVITAEQLLSELNRVTQMLILEQ